MHIAPAEFPATLKWWMLAANALMGSLIIIPAATAKRLSHNPGQMLTTSAVLAVAVTVVGSAFARRMHRETGPVIVTLAAVGFVLALLRSHGNS